MIMDKYNSLNSIYDVVRFIELNDNFYIFGASGNGLIVKRILERRFGKKVIGFLDNDKSKAGITIEGLEVLHPGDANLDDSKRIIIASLWYADIAKQLILDFKLSFLKEFGVWFYWLDIPSMARGIGAAFAEYYDSHRPEFSETINRLSDDDSKEVFKRILLYRKFFLNPELLTSDIIFYYAKLFLPDSYVNKYVENIPQNVPSDLRDTIIRGIKLGRYLYKDVSPVNKECVIDGGAYNGDTSSIFACLSPNAKIWAFEPFDSSYKELQEVASIFKNILPVKKALWKESTMLFVEDNGFDDESVRISGSGDLKVEAVSVDDFFHGENSLLDFIKLDVEGAEIEVLNGAYCTIKDSKPQLAVSIYHSPEDLWRIPLWIKDNFPKYKLYIDHKDPSILETVCFANHG